MLLEQVKDWDSEHVADWLRANGFTEGLIDQLTVQHEIDGQILLNLSESDLRQPPVALKKLSDIKRLCSAISTLQGKSNANSLPSNEDDESLGSVDEPNSSLKTSTESVFFSQKGELVDESIISLKSESRKKGSLRYTLISREELIRRIESPDTPLKSFTKLALSFFYCLLALWVTAFVMVVVHDRVPGNISLEVLEFSSDMKLYPPLPDIVLDNLPLIPWAFELCEFIGVVLCAIFCVIVVFHKHRVVILRRIFSLTGTVFLLRCVTMLITSLSVPGVHLECRAMSFGNFSEKMKQAYHIWSHMGMSIQGVRTCGDYMFSGHTTTITLLNHFITEYTPETWYGLHTTTWVLNLFGIFFILAGHEHYSIDVFVAFYISSRLFLFYHTYAYHHANLSFSDWRVRVWYPLGWLFESGSVGRVTNEFEIPFFGEGTKSETNTSSESFGVISLTNAKQKHDLVLASKKTS